MKITVKDKERTRDTIRGYIFLAHTRLYLKDPKDPNLFQVISINIDDDGNKELSVSKFDLTLSALSEEEAFETYDPIYEDQTITIVL